MSQQNIDDQQLVERYLANQLSDADREEFEAYFLEHPDVVQQLEIAARIKGGLGGLQAAGELQALIAVPNSQPANNPPSSISAERRSAKIALRPRWYFVAGIAASLVLAALLVLRWNATGPAGPLLAATSAVFTDAAGVALPVLDSYEILRVRGDTYDAVLELPAAAGVIEVRVVPEFEAPSYRVQLFAAAATDQPVAALDGLVTGNEGYLLMYLSARAVPPGQYRLDISPVSGAAPQASSFRVNVLDAKR